MKKIAILGSTGSIGTQTLEVLDHLEGDFKVEALTAGSNLELLAKQIQKYRPTCVSVETHALAQQLQAMLNTQVDILFGDEGICTIASDPSHDVIMAGMVGISGLKPIISAIQAGKTIALANKEAFVVAGDLINQILPQYQSSLIPVDSEHSAIFQCLTGQPASSVHKIYLTGSGGPFRNWAAEDIQQATVEQALNHPVWSMGKKITIDSATLMNKAFEIIEAHYLFQVPYSHIQVLIHPEGIMHSAVEFTDGSIMAQMGMPSMHLPIQYALTYPHRCKGLESNSLNMFNIERLSFQKPDLERFPCLQLGYEVGLAGGTLPAVLNGANEIVVQAFLNEKIAFGDIYTLLNDCIQNTTSQSYTTLEDILEADRLGREYAYKFIRSKVYC